MTTTDTQHIRAPAVAGRFYPADPTELRRQVRAMLDQAYRVDLRPKALVVPRAAYAYSGPVAAYAYDMLPPHRSTYQRVAIVGRAHGEAFPGLAAPTCDAFQTPLGPVPVDRRMVDLLSASPHVHLNDVAHEHEHSLEVQLPFLQVVLDEFTLVPLLVGRLDAESIAEVLGLLWGGDETLIIVSSDLTHDLPYEDAKHLDHVTAEAIERLGPEAIREGQACNAEALAALLLSARSRGLIALTLNLRNSADVTGLFTRVVGYGAWTLG